MSIEIETAKAVELIIKGLVGKYGDNDKTLHDIKQGVWLAVTYFNRCWDAGPASFGE